jgi:hypothetical protein
VRAVIAHGFLTFVTLAEELRDKGVGLATRKLRRRRGLRCKLIGNGSGAWARVPLEPLRALLGRDRCSAPVASLMSAKITLKCAEKFPVLVRREFEPKPSILRPKLAVQRPS